MPAKNAIIAVSHAGQPDGISIFIRISDAVREVEPLQFMRHLALDLGNPFIIIWPN